MRKRQKRKRQFEQMGPKMLCKRDAFEVSEEQAADLKRFCGDIWEVQGDYLREAGALRRWRSAVREAARSRLPKELPWDECWERKITNITNWKAPEPDGKHAAWLKRWNNVTTKVRDVLWQMADEGEELTRERSCRSGWCVGELL